MNPIPPEGILVRLMPGDSKPSPPNPAASTEPPETPFNKYFFKVTGVLNEKTIILSNGKYIAPNDATKIFENRGDEFPSKPWSYYKPPPGKWQLDQEKQAELIGKYVNYGNFMGGGRSSRKKINKSSKRRKSSKRARTHRNRRQHN